MVSLVNGLVEVMNFPDGTPKISCQRVHGAHIFWAFNDMSEMFTVYCITKHLRQNGANRISLVMPYIPNARMDRVKKTSEVFTLKYFCEFINDLKFDRVYVVDPHSDVSTALLNNVYVDAPTSYICQAAKSISKVKGVDPVVLFPDAGAMKRYKDCVSQVGLNVVGYANKLRDWDTGEIKGLEICGQIEEGKPVLVVDDICSYGGTFYNICKRLNDMGVKDVYLYATHCEDSVLKGDLIKSGLFQKLYTTNSLFTGTHEKIEVFEV